MIHGATHTAYVVGDILLFHFLSEIVVNTFSELPNDGLVTVVNGKSNVIIVLPCMLHSRIFNHIIWK